MARPPGPLAAVRDVFRLPPADPPRLAARPAGITAEDYLSDILMMLEDIRGALEDIRNTIGRIDERQARDEH